MNEDIITMLDEQIKAELGGLSGLAVGSKEHTEAIEGLAKLYRLRIDDSKAAMEYNKEIDDENFRRDQMEQEKTQHQEQVEREEQSRKEQLAEQKKDRYIKIGIAAAELMVPLVFFAKIYQMGYDLEKDGTFTVQTLKNLIRFVKPTKR
ncbi:hypothetical protein HLY09_26120 [Enterocloster bolteae]|jgi:hypothetical protein|nr:MULTISPECIES: hypothetical protein [Bacteria]QJU22607.1 hypothetical protein HLY09_26120 [Enterocloster bolteae]